MLSDYGFGVKKSVLVACAVVCVLVVLPLVAFADWPHDPNENLPVCTAVGDQYWPEAVSDGSGGVWVAWADARGDSSDVYAQRIDVFGNATWTPDGVAVCTAPGIQAYQAITSDGSGGAIVVWEDSRNGNWDIYAQRVDAQGQAAWPADGVPVCAAAGDQHQPKVTFDGFGGAIVTWEDLRSDTLDIYARRLGSDGTLLWTVDGERICAASGEQRDPDLVSDGAGGAIIAWVDWRGADPDIYAEHVDGEGSVLWGDDGMPICATADYQTDMEIISDDAGGALIAWRDMRGADSDLYAQRVISTGWPSWTWDGVLVTGAPDYQGIHAMATDGARGLILAWYDRRNGLSDIYAQRVDQNGIPRWTADGVVISDATENQDLVDIVPDGAGGAVIVMGSNDTGGWDLYAQRVDVDGTTLWINNGVAVSTAIGNQTQPRLVTDGAGGAIVAWQDARGDDGDIYAQRVERNGYLGDPAPGITEIIDYPNDQGGYVIASWMASYLDAFPHQVVTHYSVWRKYLGGKSPGDGARKAGEGSPPGPFPDELLDPMLRSGWSYVAQVDAFYLEQYAYDVPTYGDSTEAGIPWCGVMVLAHTEDPWVFWQSVLEAGYSVDNLPPGAPLNLLAGREDPEVALGWQPPQEDAEDLGFYAIYRSTEPGFLPMGLEDTLATAPDTTYIDTGADPLLAYYYLVSAVDVHGNEGDFSNEAGVGPFSSVEQDVGRAPSQFALHPARPNPFNPITEIGYSIPAGSSPSRVVMYVYDATGREVTTLVDSDQGPGEYRVVWDGRDHKGNEVASGVYFYRICWNGRSETRRMVLLK